MPKFVPNPTFMAQLNEGIRRALDETGEEAAKEIRNNILPYSSSTAAAVRTERAKVGIEGPQKNITMGGLGPIFEFSKQQTRRTKKGAGRGVFPRREFFNKVRDDIARRGLDLRRYL